VFAGLIIDNTSCDASITWTRTLVIFSCFCARPVIRSVVWITANANGNSA